MVIGTSIPEEISAAHLAVGDLTYLTANTPSGIFEACNGNRYLIARDWMDSSKFAVALEHHHLRRFTVLELSQRGLEYGDWWGPCRIQLLHVKPTILDENGMDDLMHERPGLLGIDGANEPPYIHLVCRRISASSVWIPIEPASEDANVWYAESWVNFDGWAIVSIDGKPFFTRSPKYYVGNLPSLDDRGKVSLADPSIRKPT